MARFHFDVPTVVFGNSLVRQLAPHVRDHHTGAAPVMVGVPGGRVDAAANDRLRRTLAPARRNPGAAAAAVVLVSGGNDVPTERTAREILDGTLALVDTASGARVGRRRRVVVANLASNGDDDVDDRWRAKRREYNRILAEASEAHPFEVLDVDGIRPELSEDGIHDTKAGYVALAAAMARALDDGGTPIDGPSPERREETSDAELGEGRKQKRRL